jgi:hypothetical protein
VEVGTDLATAQKAQAALDPAAERIATLKREGQSFLAIAAQRTGRATRMAVPASSKLAFTLAAGRCPDPRPSDPRRESCILNGQDVARGIRRFHHWLIQAA